MTERKAGSNHAKSSHVTSHKCAPPSPAPHGAWSKTNPINAIVSLFQTKQQ